MSTTNNPGIVRKQTNFSVENNKVILNQLVCPKCGELSEPKNVEVLQTNSGSMRKCPHCGASSSMHSWAVASMKKQFNRLPSDHARKYSVATLTNKIREFNKYILDKVCPACSTKKIVAKLDEEGNAVIYCDACGNELFHNDPENDILTFHGVPVNDILRAMMPRQLLQINPDEVNHELVEPKKKETPKVTEETTPTNEPKVTRIVMERTQQDITKDTAEAPKNEESSGPIYTEVQALISTVCQEVADLLIEKNRKYGNSAFEPVRLFSKADPVEAIKVRIDDKLSRLRNEQDDEDEDVVKDLMGYLVLLQVAKRMKGAKK